MRRIGLRWTWTPRLPGLWPGLLAMAAAAEIFAYHGVGAINQAQADATMRVAEQLAQGDTLLRRQVQAAKAEAAERALDTRAFRRVLDGLAEQAGVRLTRLGMDPKQPGQVTAGVTARFAGLAQFLGGVECVGGELGPVQIEPSQTAGRGAAEGWLDGTLVIAMPAALPEAGCAAAAAPARDPFAGPEVARPAEDLSARYRLTGITQIGTASVATINDQDYLPGEALDEFIVRSVQKNAVVLEKAGQSFLLHFVR